MCENISSECLNLCALCVLFSQKKKQKKHLLNFEYVSFELTQTHLFMFRVDFFVLALSLLLYPPHRSQTKQIHNCTLKIWCQHKPHHFAKHTKFQCILSEQLAIMFYSHVLVNKLPLHPVQPVRRCSATAGMLMPMEKLNYFIAPYLDVHLLYMRLQLV